MPGQSWLLLAQVSVELFINFGYERIHITLAYKEPVSKNEGWLFSDQFCHISCLNPDSKWGKYTWLISLLDYTLFHIAQATLDAEGFPVV